MKRTRINSIMLVILFCFAFFPVFAQTKEERPKKPNIIILISDDTNWGYLGAYGNRVAGGMATPNLDRIAHERVQLWSLYGHPNCTPALAAMITGKFRVGET